MAISSIAADHVLVSRFHFCSTSLSDSQTSFLAASSVLKHPFVLIAFLIVLFRPMHRTQYDPSNFCVVGIDLAQDHCDTVGFNERKAPVFELPRISYPELMNRLAQLPPAAVLMEACNGAHDKARRIADLGHDTSQVNAADVKAVRNTRHKNDQRDARYITTLFFLPDIKYVQVKTSAQQDRQLLIREYKRYQRVRIEFSNRIHSALEQYGIPTREGIQRIACHLTKYLNKRTEKITPTRTASKTVAKWLPQSAWCRSNIRQAAETRFCISANAARRH